MKQLKVLLWVLAICLIFVIFTGCSKSKKDDVIDAKAKVYEAELAVEEAKTKADAEAAWNEFKTEAEAKISENEKIIEVYNAKMITAKGKYEAKYDKKIVDLEQKNKDLKSKIINYKEDGKDKWEEFKTEFNHDMGELSTALKDFVIDNKKQEI